jgi:hypothetical protein
MRKMNTINGKVIKAAALMVLSLGSLFLSASTGKEDAADTERTIKEHILFPKLILPVQQQNQKVEVIFTTGKDGQVNFVLAKTEDKNIRSEIEKQFSRLILNKLKADVAYSVILNIKTI